MTILGTLRDPDRNLPWVLYETETPGKRYRVKIDLPSQEDVSIVDAMNAMLACVKTRGEAIDFFLDALNPAP